MTRAEVQAAEMRLRTELITALADLIDAVADGVFPAWYLSSLSERLAPLIRSARHVREVRGQRRTQSQPPPLPEVS